MPSQNITNEKKHTVRHTEIKSRRIYPEDKVTNHLTMSALIHDCVITSKIRNAYIQEETDLLLLNDLYAKKLKETRF